MVMVDLVNELGQEHRADVLEELSWSSHIHHWLLWRDKFLLRRTAWFPLL